jgi:hypothetical protein
MSTNDFAVFLNFSNPGVIKFFASVDSFEGMKRHESTNRVVKLLETYLEN